MAYENIQWGLPQRQRENQQNQMMQLLGSVIQQRQFQQQMDMRERQLEQERNQRLSDPKSMAQNAVMAALMGKGMSQEEAAMQMMYGTQSIGLNPATGMMTVQPSKLEQWGLSKDQGISPDYLGQQAAPVKKAPLTARTNNAIALRPVGASEGFQQFETPEQGIAAGINDLRIKVSGRSQAMKNRYGENYEPTLENILTTFAPPEENDTKSYIDFVSKNTGIAPNQTLTEQDIPNLMNSMVRMEGGQSGYDYFQPYMQQKEGFSVPQPPRAESPIGMEGTPVGEKIRTEEQSKRDLEFWKRKTDQAKSDFDKGKAKEKVEYAINKLENLNDQLLAKSAMMAGDKDALENLKAKWGSSWLGRHVQSVTKPEIESLRQEYGKVRDSLIPFYIVANELPATVVDTEEFAQRVIGAFGDPSSMYNANLTALETQRQQFGLKPRKTTKGGNSMEDQSNQAKRLRYNPQTGQLEPR